MKKGTRVRKLPRLAGMRVVGIIEMGAVGIVGPIVALDSSGMSVTVWQEQHVRKIKECTKK